MDPIYASPAIGNIIDVHLRIYSTSYPGVITVSGSKITIDPAGAIEGEYDLVIESYDNNSSLKSTLMTDNILIRILATPYEPEDKIEFPKFSSTLEIP